MDNWLKTVIKKLKPEYCFAFFSAMIVGLATHMYAMTNNLLTYDSMWNLFSSQDMISSGRQFLTYACRISSDYSLPWVNGLLAIIYLAVASVLITEAFEVKGKIYAALIGALMVTFPSVTATFAYSYTVDGYMLAAVFSIAAFLITDRKKLGFIPGAVLLGLCLGIYQAYFSFTILLCIFALLKKILKNTEPKKLMFFVLKYAGMGILGYVFYALSLKLMLLIKGAKVSGYQGTDAVLGFSFKNLGAGIRATLSNFGHFLLEGGVFSTTMVMKISYLLIMIFGVLLFIFLFIKKQAYKKVINIVLTVLLSIAFPFGACVVSLISPDMYYHILIRFSWVLILMFIVSLLPMTEEERKEGSVKKRFSYVVCGTIAGLVCVLSLEFFVAANIAYYNLNERYEKSYAMCIRLVDRIESTEGYTKDTPVAILGGFPDSSYYPSTDITKDALKGYFGIDGDYVVNSSKKYAEFMSHYLNFTIKTLEESEEINLAGTKEFAEMLKFPNKESVRFINGVLVIKLNG